MRMNRYDIVDIQKEGINTSLVNLLLPKVKSHLLISNSNDDTLLKTVYIPSAIDSLELYTGLSFYEKDIVLTVEGYCGYPLPLPYGPIQSIDDIMNAEEIAIEESAYKVIGVEFLKVDYNFSNRTTIYYTAGYETLPPALEMAILHQVYHLYENRVNGSFGLCQPAKALAHPYKRYEWM